MGFTGVWSLFGVAALAALPNRLRGGCASTALPAWESLRPARGRAPDQKAGTTAPLYFFSMKALTSGLVSAAESFFKASLSLLSGRATR